ncbi:hypothetical protein ACVBE9_06270 [Eionea flava]
MLLHALVSAVALTAVLLWVFIVWFPSPFAEMLRIDNFFLIIAIVDFCLGPLITLVIYNPLKSQKELLFDYIIITLLQVGVLLYGLYTLSESRPVYVVFVKDRLEVVVAGDFDAERLAKSSLLEYKVLPHFGPRSICSNRPQTPEETNHLLFSGYDVQHMPKYFRPCNAGELVKSAYPVERLLSIINTYKAQRPDQEQVLDGLLREVSRVSHQSEVVWLPVTHRFGAWVALINVESGQVNRYINVNPFQ